MILQLEAGRLSKSQNEKQQVKLDLGKQGKFDLGKKVNLIKENNKVN